MTRRRDNHSGAALGLYGSMDSWHLVKLERDGAGFRAAAHHTIERVSDADSRAEVEQLMSRLQVEDRGLPLGVALADHVGMFRRIAAPPAADTVLDKVVASQVETMLPGGADQVRWGWSRVRTGKELWIHAMVRSDIDAALAVLPVDAQAVSAISDTMALTRLLISDETPSNDAVIVLSVGMMHSTMLLVSEGELKGVVACDGGCDTACTDGLEHTDWTSRLSDARDELLSAITPDHRPVRCQLVCPLDSRQRLSEIAERVIGLPMDAWNSSGDITGLENCDHASMIAASAAAGCFESVTPTIRLIEQRAQGAALAQLKKYAVVAAVWLLAALMVLYVSDRYRAGRVNDLLSGGALDEERLLQINRQIDVARYLEMSGPIPLAIIDEIGQKTQGFMLESLSYERGGTVRISGKQPSADAIGKLTEELAMARTLWAVQLQSQTGADNGIRFDIIAMASPKYFGAFVEPPPPEAPPEVSPEASSEVPPEASSEATDETKDKTE